MTEGATHLFLYGTLQPAADTPMSRWLAERTLDTLPATVPGRLVAIPAGDGWYPALIPGPSRRRCSGTLVRARFRPGHLALLDRYEGREYRRCVLRVRTAEGHLRPAGVYLWRGGVPHRALPVPGGDFLDWLARTRRRAFTTLRQGA